MENENQQNPYGFLEDQRCERHFAELNVRLLSGRHILYEEYNLYTLLEDFFDELKRYYNNLYKLNLVKDTWFNSSYYYLDFFEGTKRKLSDTSRFRELTQLQTVIGLMLLDLFYVKFFDEPKMISWSEIKAEIQEGDKKDEFQRFLFRDVRTEFTPAEWNRVEKNIRRTVQSFEELGWIEIHSNQSEELLLELKPSIHRMAKLYAKELENFEAFLTKAKIGLAE